MVKAVKGCLIETDPSIREIILKITEGQNIIIEDINDTMLFIDAAYKDVIADKVAKFLKVLLKKDEPKES